MDWAHSGTKGTICIMCRHREFQVFMPHSLSCTIEKSSESKDT